MVKISDRKVRLYDPHPGGIYGAICPLPTNIKKVIDSLDGKITTLDEAVNEIRKEADKIRGDISIVDNSKIISLELHRGWYTHHWRLIGYQYVNR